MMKQYYFILSLLLPVLNTFSQPDHTNYDYVVNLNELEMKTYEKDSTANALVLYEYGNSFIEQHHFRLITEEKHKVKILNREGFDEADVTIFLFNSKNRSETIKDIVATTYNLVDGRTIKTKLDLKNDVFKERYNENYTLVKFTMPNVKVGSVITYSFTRSSPFKFKYKGWNFQSDIPKLYSEYRASIPGNWLYNIKLVGKKKLFINESVIKNNCLDGGNGSYANCSFSTYAMKDIPAFIDEDYMTSKYNYLARIEYELQTVTGFDGVITNYAKTWKTVDREFRTDKDIGKQLNKSIKLEEHLSGTIINEKEALKKAEAIYKHIQERYTWNKEYEIFKDVSVKDLIKNRSGNVSAINILLHNMLKAAGISVKPVLLSTRDNGFPTKIYPVITDFNYLVVQATINDQSYFLDATDDYLSFGELPFRCLNRYGRLMDFKKGSSWIDIAPKALSTVQYRTVLNMNENGTIVGEVFSKTTGYHALNKRKRYFGNSDSYITELEDHNPNIDISNFELTKGGKTNSEFVESYQVSYNSDDTGDIIYLNPFFTKFFTENPFKLQERTYPIDFGYKDVYYYTLRLNLGENYSILEKPKDLNFAIPNKKGNVILSSIAQGSAINILFKINFNDSIYGPEYYPYLKAFMSKVVDIQKNALILIKKK